MYLLHFPLVSLQVERRKPRDEIAHIQNTKELETVHEQVQHFVILLLASRHAGTNPFLPENHIGDDIHREALNQRPQLHS